MRNALALGIYVCALGLAADAPYAGKWKMNVAKSDMGETTLTYEQMSGGEWKATMDGQSYTFKTDGKEAATPWGTTTSWKAVDATTWDVTDKVNGKVMDTTKVKLSADGKTLTLDSKRMKADGGSSNDSVTFQRVSGGPGLAGKWKTKKMTSSSPDSLVLTPKGSDGLTVAMADEAGACDARFDGKDYPAKGKMWPAGWTCAIAKNGARGFDLTWKKDGKEMYKTTLTVSEDGKTLTETGGAAASGEKIKMVYDRQ